MRIGTWNVGYGTGEVPNARRLAHMIDIDADVWVLTETHDSLSLADIGYTAVHGEQRPVGAGENDNVREGSRWVTIWSRLLPIVKIDLEANDPRRAASVAASGGGELAIYGTVLPWTGDKETGGMEAVLGNQQPEWARLRSTHGRLCVAGDFNVNLDGPHYYGSNKSKAAVKDALARSGLVAATDFAHTKAHAPDRKYGIIDHIAVPLEIEPECTIASIWGRRNVDGEVLSDHSGVAIDVPSW